MTPRGAGISLDASHNYVEILSTFGTDSSCMLAETEEPYRSPCLVVLLALPVFLPTVLGLYPMVFGVNLS